MDIFDMDEETFERWQKGAVSFGRKIDEYGIRIIELDDSGIKISPDIDNPFLKGMLFLGFAQVGLERVEIRKYGDPVSLTEVHITHLGGESILRIPNED